MTRLYSINFHPCRNRSLLSLALVALAVSAPLAAAAPTTVTVTGSMQSEVGCGSDWDPTCVTTNLAYDANDDVWQGTFLISAGSFEYKAAINGAWTVNYGLHAILNGANIPLNAVATQSVKFYYDDKTHWVTDNIGSVIATAAGSFQSELGCPGDWQPDCLRSWLQDPDGDGIYTFTTTALPAGFYDGKVAINESFVENYGQGGVPNGPNIPFVVPFNGAQTAFRYDSTTHVMTIMVAPELVGTANNFSATQGVPRAGSVGTFTSARPGSVAADFSATINWGDGTTTAASSIVLNAGTFTVNGTHAYAASGSFAVTVTVNDSASSAAVSIADTATVVGPPMPVPGLSGWLVQLLGFMVTLIGLLQLRRTKPDHPSADVA
jgi:hypothetical protein